MKYRKKPVVIEAIQWTGFNLEEIQNFVEKGLSYDFYDTAWRGTPYVCMKMKIKTLEGDMEVSKYDYIIKGVNGEFYQCKPNIFMKTYEAVDDDNNTFRDATTEEIKSVNDYIEGISKPTGVNFDEKQNNKKKR